MQLITGMSGNVGIQCSTVLVRGMSTGELSVGSRKKAIKKELGIGLFIGSFFGVACGLLIYTLMQTGLYHLDTDPRVLSATVGCGVWGACVTATVLGTFSPFFFAYLRIDPAIASGPIVTAFNDVFSALMFFLIARMVFAFFTLIG
jgi:magnesium transporter